MLDSYFATELNLLLSEPPFVSNNLRRTEQSLYKAKEINAILRVGPEFGISGSVTNLKHGISHMYSTWRCTHARMHASAFRRNSDLAASSKLTYLERLIS